MRCSPDHRWHAVATAQVEPVHPIEASCWRHVQQLEMSPAIDRALEIYMEQFERERLQPWLIAGAGDEDIHERVGLTIDTTRVYRHLFFDVSVFRDLLDKQLWVHRYNGSPEGLAYLQKAMLHGVEAVAHVMGAHARLDPNHVVEASMKEAFFRAQAMRSTRLSSTETMMAHQLLRTAIDTSQLLTKTRPANITDIMLKLKSRDLTQPMDEIELHGEILH